METITLYTPLFTLDSDIFIIAMKDIEDIIDFLLIRKKNLPYLREFYKGYCVVDMDFSIEGDVLVSKFITETLIVSVKTLLNMVFGSPLYRIINNIIISCDNTISPYIELPYYTESFKYYTDASYVKYKLENLLDMKVVVDRLDSRVYVGTYVNPISEVMRYGCYTLADLARMHW